MKKLLFIATLFVACTKQDIDPAIVGVYQVIRAEGIIFGRTGANVKFDRKGKFSEQGRTSGEWQELGTYTATGNTLTIDTRTPQTCNYVLDGNRLTLTKEGNQNIDVLIKQ